MPVQLQTAIKRKPDGFYTGGRTRKLFCLFIYLFAYVFIYSFTLSFVLGCCFYSFDLFVYLSLHVYLFIYLFVHSAVLFDAFIFVNNSTTAIFFL